MKNVLVRNDSLSDALQGVFFSPIFKVPKYMIDIFKLLNQVDYFDSV